MQTEILAHAPEIAEMLDKLAATILEQKYPEIMLLGIQRRGADIAQRLAKMLEAKLGKKLPFGTLDINLYRDDWTSMQTRPTIGKSHIATSVDEKIVILVDDVLFTGRTIRAALEAILDYGRPRKIELLVLVDRGNRELPIHPDYAGMTVQTLPEDQIDVLLQERDGRDAIVLHRKH